MGKKKNEFTFFVDVNDGELAVIEARDLPEAKKIFADTYPEDVDKVGTITSLDGYEQF